MVCNFVCWFFFIFKNWFQELVSFLFYFLFLFYFFSLKKKNKYHIERKIDGDSFFFLLLFLTEYFSSLSDFPPIRPHHNKNYRFRSRKRLQMTRSYESEKSFRKKIKQNINKNYKPFLFCFPRI